MLFNQVKNIITNIEGVAGLVIKELKNNEVIKINENEIFPAASVIKLTVLWELFKQIEKGKIRIDNEVKLLESYKVGGYGILKELHSGLNLTIKDLATLMIVISDNVATNILIDLLNLKNINSSIYELGLKETKLQRKMMDVESARKGLDNYTSPAEVAELLEQFVTSKKISGSSKEQIIDILKRQQCNNMLPVNFSKEEVILAHKTGDLPGIKHDVGIMYLENNLIITVVMIKNLKNDKDGILLSNKIGKVVYEYFKKKC